MQNIENIYTQLKEAKLKRKVLKDSIRDELAANTRFQELKENVEKMKTEMKQIKAEILSRVDKEEIEVLNREVKNITTLLADIALNMYVQNETVQIVDPIQGTLLPQFSVKFSRK